MSGINHIAGGIVLTGILASFKDVNIFSSVGRIGLTMFFSLLPDIDCPSSIVGRLFLPISQYLNRNFGHRTITHSLLVYVLLGLLVGVLERIWCGSSVITLIYFLSYFIHLLLDMLTWNGVPLLYPFKRNPFVMPANPSLRLKSGDVRTEVIIFILFIGIAISYKGLFKNGFWTTYNQSFGSIKHLKREFARSQDLLSVNYDYLKSGSRYTGKGYVVGTSSQGVFVYNGQAIICLDRDSSFKELSYKHTSHSFQIKSESFKGLSSEQLHQKIDGKVLIRLKLQSNVPFKFQGSQSFKDFDEAHYVINPILVFVCQTDRDTNQLYHLLKKLKSDKLLLEKEGREIEGLLSKMDDYNREISTQRLKKIRKLLEKLADEINRNKQLIRLNEALVNNPVKLEGELWYIDMNGLAAL